jgi:hypothetical protein
LMVGIDLGSNLGEFPRIVGWTWIDSPSADMQLVDDMVELTFKPRFKNMFSWCYGSHAYFHLEDEILSKINMIHPKGLYLCSRRIVPVWVSEGMDFVYQIIMWYRYISRSLKARWKKKPPPKQAGDAWGSRVPKVVDDLLHLISRRSWAQNADRSPLDAYEYRDWCKVHLTSVKGCNSRKSPVKILRGFINLIVCDGVLIVILSSYVLYAHL